MKEFIEFRGKTYAYLMDDHSKHKKAKGTKKCVIKRRLMFENHTDCLFNDKIKLKLKKKDFKGIIIMYILNKSIKLHQIVMMI